MASVISDPNGRKRIQFMAGNGARRTIRLGKATMRQAESIKVRVEQLALAATGATGVVDEETIKWLAGLDDVMYEKLAAVGLVGRRDSLKLGAFLDGYIKDRHEVKAGTTTVYGHTRRNLLDYFGEDKLLRDITPGDADQWRLYLIGQGLALNTVRRRCGIAKQFFRAAGRRKLIAANPFEDLRSTVQGNPKRVAREHYLQVTEDHFRQATEIGNDPDGVAQNQAQQDIAEPCIPSLPTCQLAKNDVIQGPATPCEYPMGRVGREHPPLAPSKRPISGEFGAELKRPFPVHEHCYDCAEFYYGCMGWRAAKDFACKGYNRLPDVMPGTYGQVFPPSRRSGLIGNQRAERTIPVGRSHSEHIPSEGVRLSPEVHNAEVRTCGCGAILPKSKRFCDSCRIQNRRRTKRAYMRGYMEQRRSAVGSGSGVLSPAPGMPFVRAAAEKVPSIRPTSGGTRFGRSSVLTQVTLLAE